MIDFFDDWKQIDKFNTYYINKKGDVLSFPKRGNHYKFPTILKQNYDKDGYKTVSIIGNDKKKHLLKVHRLVAKAFIPNPQGFPCVNHKNEVKSDNSVENLEWCSVKYNNSYNGRIKRAASKNKKKLNQLDKFGNLIRVWDSATDASKQTNISKSSIINCCNKKLHFITAGGYKWEYIKEEQ